MSKLLPFLLLVLVSGCSDHRMTQQETLLAFHAGKDKICLLSVFPDKDDSTGIYLSTILVNDAETGHLSAYVTAFSDRTDLEEQFFRLFIPPNYFDTTAFPVILTTGDTNQRPFTFSMSRKMISLEALPQKDFPPVHYQVEYAKQEPFHSTSIGTAFAVHALKPLNVKLTDLNDLHPEQSSVLNLHVLENPAPLFDKRSGKHYFWIDFCLYGDTGYSLFFESDVLGKITVIQSTFPGTVTVEQLPDRSFSIETNDPAKNLRIFSLDPDHSPAAIKGFRIQTVGVAKNGQPAGTGIIYQL